MSPIQSKTDGSHRQRLDPMPFDFGLVCFLPHFVAIVFQCCVHQLRLLKRFLEVATINLLRFLFSPFTQWNTMRQINKQEFVIYV